MAMWLFRRRSRRKRPHSGTPAGDDGSLARSQTAPAFGVDQPPARQMSSKKRRTDRTEPNKLQRRHRTYSFESGREDEIRIGRKRSTRGPKRESAPPTTHAPGANPATSLGNSKIAQAARADGEKRETGDMILDHDAAFQRIPTLHASKRDGGHLMSRKLSKRQKNSHDREREAELKALRDFTPVRPATNAWTAGRPMKKDSRRVKSGFALVKPPWDKEQHTSDVSLPIPESIHSSLSSDSEQVSYKVSAFDVLAPKPTLRYAVYPPRWGYPYSGGSAPARTDSQRRKFSDRAQIPEATLKAHKRIDDLADDLTASDLRELMERDKRRRERKRERDQQKIERKLAKAAENQRRDAENGRESPPNLERGVMGRETAPGFGPDSTSAIITSSRHRPSPPRASPRQLGKLPAEDSDSDHDSHFAEDAPKRPLEAFLRVSSIPLESHTPAEQPKEETPHPASPTQPQPKTDARSHSPERKGFLLSKKTRSKSPLSDPEHSDTSGTPRKTSKNSETSARGPLSWTSIFKWGRKPKRSSGPSSFSNTSRDSMTTQPQVAAAPPLNVTFVPPAAPGLVSAPKRTRSRFREDLPELPLSPPDSRMQSPEHSDPVHPAIIEQDTPPARDRDRHDADLRPTAPINIPGARYDTPTTDSTRQTPHSWTREGVDPSPEPTQSMSLASIDSEGSWLSGRLRSGSGRVSSQMRHRRQQPSVESSNDDAATETAEDHDRSMEEEEEEDSVAGIADDEYLNRVTVAHTRAGGGSSAAAWANRKSTGEARPSSDEDDDARWGAVVGGKQPTVVHSHAADRMKSREGLLNMVVVGGAEDDDEHKSETGEMVELDSPVSPVSASGEDGNNPPPSLQRATSIKLGDGHARHISAGSAKLLELSPRTSVDNKRRSSDKWAHQSSGALVE